jgi:hypothetical protein
MMNRASLMAAATVVLGMLALASVAGAAGRAEAVRKPLKYEVDDAVGNPADWTKRLVGRFRMEGSIHHEYEIIDHGDRDADPRQPFEVWDVSLQGKADCIDFTEAAGLQCVLNVSWQEQWRNSMKDQLGGMPDLTPGMLLAGLTPATDPGKIRILGVDKRGLAHPGSVRLGGFTARSQLPCVNMPGTQKCQQVFTVTAKPGSRLIFVSLVTTVRAVRSKMERKVALDQLPDGSIERDRELYEERLTVSLSLRREQVAAPGKPAAQGSR